MDSKQAIELLHNNQYQKHLGNGEYDYIHPLTDAEAKAIESLIERQELMILRAIALIQEANGGCPFPSGCSRIKDDEWAMPCTMFNDDARIVECWRRWLEQEAKHDNRTA